MIKNIVINDDMYNILNLAYIAGYNIKYIDKNSVVHQPIYQLLDKHYAEINCYYDTTDKQLCNSLVNLLDDIANGDYIIKPDKIKVYFKQWCILFVKAL